MKGRKTGLCVMLMILSILMLTGCKDDYKENHVPTEAVVESENVTIKDTQADWSIKNESVMNDVTEKESDKDDPAIDESTKETRRVILTLPWGDGKGQLKNESNPALNGGPEAFVIEDEAIYILDRCNKRIVIYHGGEFSDFPILDCPYATYMAYQEGLFGVVDNFNRTTGVYTTTGEIVAIIKTPEEIQSYGPFGLVEVTSSYVIWKSPINTWYRYDWKEKKLETVTRDAGMYTRENSAIVRMRGSEFEWEITGENMFWEMLRVNEDELFYEQFEYPSYDWSVRRLDREGNVTFSYIDYSRWFSSPECPIYVADDGKVYLLEDFEDHFVISEVILGKTEKNQEIKQ